MKLGVLTVPLYSKPAEEAFEYLSSLGVQTLEIGVGGSPGNKHLNPAEYLDNPSKIKEYQALVKKYNLTVSAFSVHGNGVHPNKAIAEKDHSEFVQACKLAQQFGVDRVVTFSGCPGDFPGAKYPNWVTCAWPTDFSDILKYQWDEVLIPYWRETAKVANSYGIYKVAFEMHPGFCVYNPKTLLRIREAVGETIGANFDPSHLFWQGINPSDAIRYLKGAIYHFHAKDTLIIPANVRVNGVLETSSYTDYISRGWYFRTVGYGHDELLWKDIISTLMAIGYDDAISIEHEDGLMSVTEGLEKAIDFLKHVMIFDELPEAWWV
ncbi:MAG: sugar phosphate isomerase/epimerase [Clostridiales bacterium]|jgi:sugar phosphate isomerase/epimerase|nr:sugar phosphate isomerase/epimerase [Clostridiales bacterium]